ncbi:O-antigen ligase family protein [Methylophilaceae bacterium]|nr:O-antigen ligase family protein [Methylophilaceae bacterium]
MSSFLKLFEKNIVFLLPILLIFSRSAADITIVSIGLIFLYRSYKLQDWEWLGEKWFLCSLIFVGYLLFINTPMSINTKGSLLYSLAFIRWPLFAMALSYWLLKSQINQKKLLAVMAVTLIFIAFDTWWQYFFRVDIFGYLPLQGDRLTGPFRENNSVPGIFLARLTFILFYIGILFSQFNNPKKKIFLILIITTTMLLTVFITGERMALILALSGSMLSLAALYFQYPNYRRIISLGCFVFLSFVAVLAFNFTMIFERQVIGILDKLSNFYSSDYGIVYQSAYNVWMQSPIFGVGIHQYRLECIAQDFKNTGVSVCAHPHNISFELLSETGIVGFFLYYLMIVSIGISALKEHLSQKKWLYFFFGFTLLFISFFPLIGGMSLFNNWIAATIWLFSGWVLALKNS